ncbi:YkgJ family cysteine cluster protein [Marinilabilia sp.]|uniref:YkgJ family cysteine cluster protein n=1 Tax=Marinilabilia sp. TaxID=2021252 RepID=UPI0025BDB6B7|nr:YkgJ family cysteine cluster protein [Marinilabilia sp.]
MVQQIRPEGFEQIFFADGNNLGKAYPVQQELSKLKIAQRQLYHNVDLLIDAFSQRCESDNVPVACHMGCQWCCHQAVFASTHEMVVLMDYLEKRFSSEVVDEIKQKAKAKEAKLSGLSPQEALNTSHPCPFLRKGSCMVYPVRPLGCRIYLSSNEESCKAKYQHPEDPKAIPALFDFTLKAGRQLNEGFAAALKEEGLSVEEHRIEHIFLQLLKLPDKKNEWLHGATIHESFPFDEIKEN